MQQPSDEHPNMTVLQTLQKGYQLHDRMLRPAKVVVSKSAEQNPASSDSSSTEAGTSTE
jgi:molecular chaperone GrpE